MNQSKRRPRHPRIRLVGICLISVFYVAAILAPFVAPYDYHEQSKRQPSAPPSLIRFFYKDGNWSIRPFFYAQKLVDTRDLRYEDDESQKFPIYFFVRGSSYSIIGLFQTDLHFFGTAPSEDGTQTRVNLLGTDQLGRDRFSRLLFAIRFSLTVAPIGVILACILGILFGALSGYASRGMDALMMGVADTTIALPTMILILAARAAFPLELPPFSAAAMLIVIFALTGWAEMARLTRGLVLAMRQREFVLAARATGVTEARILIRHIIPNIALPLIEQASLMLPVFMLAEIALSFLGVGLQEPEPSLGNMLSTAGDLTLVRNSPIVILLPAIIIFLFVFAVRLIKWERSQNI